MDSVSEIARSAAITPGASRQPVMVRMVPGITVGRYVKVRTGADGQKFGLPLTDGAPRGTPSPGFSTSRTSDSSAPAAPSARGSPP